MVYVYMKVITKCTENSAFSYIWNVDYFICVPYLFFSIIYLFIYIFFKYLIFVLFLICSPGVLKFLSSYMFFLDMFIMCLKSSAFSKWDELFQLQNYFCLFIYFLLSFFCELFQFCPLFVLYEFYNSGDHICIP